jgi:type I restriction-modification system DNA methylase subunit
MASSFNELSSFIWSVADLLRGDFKQSEYGRVILPFTVLRRLDCVLTPTKEAALKEHAARQAAGIAFEPFVKRKTSLDFYNVSSLDMGKLMGDQDNIRANLDKELEGAIIDALSAHSTMSKQALESAELRADLKAVLLGAGRLWEGLRAKAAGAGLSQ